MQLLWARRGDRLKPIRSEVLFDPRIVAPRGLTGLYREDIDFHAPVTTARVDPAVAIRFHGEPPLRSPFTVEWSGELYAPEDGRYILGTEQIDETRLIVDGRLLLTNRQPNTLAEAEISLAKGWHRVRLLFRGLTGYFHVYLHWTPPNRPRSVVPSTYLRPTGTGGSPAATPPPLQ
jgi:hypothetical protein